MVAGAPLFDRGVRATVFPPVALGGGAIPPFIINPIPPAGAGAESPVQLHVRFTVDKSLTPEPQRATISIWNLQKTTRDLIAGACVRVVDWIPGGVPAPLVAIDSRIVPSDPIVMETQAGVAHVILEAGYGALLSTLFAGMAAPVINRRAGPDWITTLQCGDSELGLTQGWASKSFEPGTPASVVLAYLASCCGLKVAPTAAAAALSGDLLQQGLLAEGRAREGISDMLGALELDWWADDGVLWILAPGEILPGPPLVVSPVAVPGVRRLLESPMRIDGNGLRIRMQLAPDARVGAACVITSSEVAGTYRIEHLTHRGDNRTGPFETEAIVRSQLPIGF